MDERPVQRLLLLRTLFLPACLGLCAPTLAADLARAERSETSPRLLVHDDLFAVATLGPGRAIAVGSWGRLIRTGDGGASWEIASVEAPRALLDLDFADAQHGWIVGERGLVLATRDGGVAWTPQASPTQLNLFAVTAVDARRVWAAGEQGTILRTEDGGANWSDASLGEDVILNDVFFADERRGWIVGEFGTILRTEDAGASWQPPDSVEGVPPDVYLYAVHFQGDEGLVTGLGGTALRSTDAGRTWTPVDAATRNHVYALGRAETVRVGVGDQAVIRLFGGDSGRPPDRRPEASLWLRDVAFSGTEGFAVGAKSQVLHTTNGGRTWRDVSVPRVVRGQALPEEIPK